MATLEGPQAPALAVLATLPEGTRDKGLNQLSDTPVVPVMPDDGDVRRIDRTLNAAYRQAMLENADQPWQDRGHWLARPAALLTVLWFRRGWTMRWAAIAVLALGLAAPQPARAEGVADWFFTPDQQGRLAYQRKDYARAAELFIDPLWRGYALHRDGQYEAAAEVLGRVETAEAAFMQGMAYIKSRSYRDGVRAFETTLERDPDYPNAVDTFADPDTNEPTRATLTTEELAFSGVVPEGAEGLDPFLAAEALELEQEITGEPEAMAPGDSVIRTVTATIRGTSPMFLPDLLPGTMVAGVAAYPDEPALEETDDRAVLSGTRTERVTLVAEGGGSGEAPPVSLEWYNLETGEVETATLEGFAIAVDGPPARSAEPRDWRAIALAALAGVLALALALWLLHRFLPPLGHWLQARHADWLASEAHAYGHLRRVVGRRDHAALHPALDAWVAKMPRPDPRRRGARCSRLCRKLAARPEPRKSPPPCHP